VHFVRLTTVAVAAELRHGISTCRRGVLASNEEHGCEGLATDRPARHAVLIVAGRAGHRVHRVAGTTARTEGCQRITSRIPEGRRIVGHEGCLTGTGGDGSAAHASAGAVPVVPGLGGRGRIATDHGVHTHGMVVVIGRPAGGSRLGEQGRSVAAHDGQGFYGRTLHHANISQYAIMTAQAKEDDGVSVMGAGDRAVGRERNGILIADGAVLHIAVAAENQSLAE